MRIKLNMQHLLGGLLALGLSASGAYAQPKYGSLSEPDFQKVVEQIKADPTLLAKQKDLTYQLTTQQWETLIKSEDLDEFTWVYPAVVKGKNAPALQGKKIDELSVMAVRGGKLVPIPYQIDEKDKNGWVYVKGVSEAAIDGTEGVMDPNDELVFMYRDTGSDRYNAGSMKLESGKILQELTFQYGGKTRYAYVVTGSNQRSPVQYVQYNDQTRVSDSTFYTFTQAKENLLMFKDFKAHAGPTPQHRVLDTVILDLSTGVITSWPRISITLSNLQARMLGSKHGPIRNVLLANIVVVVAKIPVFYIRTDFTIYDQGISLPVKLHIPGGEVLTRVLNKPIINIGLDMHDLKGGRFGAAVNPTGQYGKVDGQMSDVEKKMNIRVPDKNWLWLDSGRGWDVVMQVKIPPTWPVEAKLLYEDAVKPEQHYEEEDFPDALPRMGVTVTKLPVGQLDINLSALFWFPATVGPNGPEPFTKAMDNPPTVMAGNGA